MAKGNPLGVGFDQSAASAGARVRAARIGRDVSLRELAAELGMSASALSDFETGKSRLRPSRLSALSERLGIDLTPTVPAMFDDWRAYSPVEVPRVYAAALELFSERGYHGASMRMIAERAGISVAGLYHHESGKHDLLTWLLDRAMDELMARCEAAAATSVDPLRQVQDLTECLVRFHAGRRAWALLAATEQRALQPEARAKLWRQRAWIHDTLRSHVVAARGVDPKDAAADRTAIAIVTMSVAVSDWYRNGVDDADAIAATYAELAAAMVQALPHS